MTEAEFLRLEEILFNESAVISEEDVPELMQVIRIEMGVTDDGSESGEEGS